MRGSACIGLIDQLIEELNFEELNIDGLSVHLNVLCLKYVSKVQSYNDHVCSELLELSQKIGRTSFYNKLLFKKFV